MLEVVLGFALINILFELTVLGVFVPVRPRLLLLGNQSLLKAIHVVMLIATLYVHWGTVSGTMAGFVAFPASIVAMALAKQVFGFITMEPRQVSSNNLEFYQHLPDEGKTQVDCGSVVTVMVPIYHRRILGYTVAELKERTA